MEISKAYDPKQAEQHHYARWEASGFFAPEINTDPDAKPFSIVIPPPNVTGTLHMGHALQHTLMDVLTRWKRMLGYRALFLVGVDHAGISTQLMVTRQLKKETHKSPQDIGREAFVEKVWEWKNKYGGEITRQIRREGLSVDWTRERFTMEENLSKAVREVFVRLYEDGSIYRGTRIVNWCPRDKTVLSDLEVKEEKAKDGKLYYLRYPVCDAEKGRGGDEGTGRRGHAEISEDPQFAVRNPQSYITVATTRPETMLGDTAVAVSPEDERYKDLVGKTVALPLTGREIPIIADEYVETEFGTGAVKITPAHDANDWEIGERHGLEKLVVIDVDATMTKAAGKDYAGLDRFEARAKVVEEFEKLGLLEKIEDYDVILPHCERCNTIIEPLLSEQWFVNMEEMRDLALKLMREDALPKFYPEVPHRKVYTNWLENLKDWTISRQLWWGHQIPAWYDEEGNTYVARTQEEAFEQAGTQALKQDEDVLDTWFSSALWPFSTLGWTGEEEDEKGRKGEGEKADSDLDAFYPTDVLVTGRDIISLWVSRMVMTGMKFMGVRPFDDVIIHGTVLDKNGQRMSKTKNNGIDPLDVFERYGVDATRMTLAGSSTGMDFAWRDERVESYRNFANKIWNATRFCLINSDGAQVGSTAGTRRRGDLSLPDRWIISRLNKTAKAVNRALDTYQFHEAVQLLYHFFWDDFCDWYIELVKDEISSRDWENEEGVDAEKSSPPVLAGVGAASAAGVVQSAIRNPQSAARSRILSVLEQSLRLLHPFMPFLTEELWQTLPGVSNGLHNKAYASAEQTIMLTTFPTGDDTLIDEKAESEMASVIELITKVRNIRAEMNIKAGDQLSIHVAANPVMRTVFSANESQIKKLARADKIVLAETLDVPKASARSVLAGNAEIAVPLEGLINFEKERARLQGQIEKLDIELQRLNGQLSNKSFVEKAPLEKVDALRVRLAELNTQTSTLELNLKSLE